MHEWLTFDLESFLIALLVCEVQIESASYEARRLLSGSEGGCLESLPRGRVQSVTAETRV